MTTTLNATTSNGLVVTPDNSGVIELQSNGTTELTISSAGAYGQLISGTAVASTSGTSIDFTSLPSWIKRITVMFNGVSLNSTANLFIQLGTSSGVVSTGYTSTSNIFNNASGSSGSSSTSAFLIFDGTAAYALSGTCVITLVSSNTFVATHSYLVNTTNIVLGSGSVSLGGTLDRVRITSSNGTDTFDAGSINILYEG
jgi:hypothetical protein